MKWEEGLKVLF